MAGWIQFSRKLDGTIKLLERHDAKVLGRIGSSLSAARSTSAASTEAAFSSSAAPSIPVSQRTRGEWWSWTARPTTITTNWPIPFSRSVSRGSPSTSGWSACRCSGHSDNHAGLQIADLLASAILAPIACSVYAGAYETWNVHRASCHLDIRERFGPRLNALTFPTTHPQTGLSCSSLLVHDPVGKRRSSLMYWPKDVTPKGKYTQRNGRKGRPKSAGTPKGGDRRAPAPKG